MLGGPEHLSHFPSYWAMSYLSDLFRTCRATHSTPGYILSLACSIILEMLVIKGKNSWGFFSMKIIKNQDLFDPLPFRMRAALCCPLDTITIAIILVSFSIFLGSSISQGSQSHEMLYKKTTEERSSKMSCTFN